MKKAVKHVLQQCCSQLRSKLLKRYKNKENAQRKKNLSKVSFFTLDIMYSSMFLVSTSPMQPAPSGPALLRRALRSPWNSARSVGRGS